MRQAPLVRGKSAGQTFDISTNTNITINVSYPSHVLPRRHIRSRMKRHADFDSKDAGKRRRQPQVSCDSCRKKKLKCDRGNPCASCVVRGSPCTGHPNSHNAAVQLSNTTLAPGIGSDDSILGRLRKLEHAVFGSAASAGASTDQVSVELEHEREGTRTRTPIATPTSQRPSQKPLQPSERQQTAMFFDSTFTRNDLSISFPYDKVDYHVTHVSQFPKTPASITPGQNPTDYAETRLSAWFMTHEEALLLLQDFIDNPYHLLNVIHAPAARLTVDHFYQSLLLNEDPNPAHAALILSIAATSAFFYNESSKSTESFASLQEATQAALSWLKSALDILEKCRPSGLSCLEEVQARMLGLMGGPTDGTYNVQPRQMNVKYPRNINDDEASLSDETFTMAPETPTAMSCFIKRIQFAELARSIIDARVPGVPDAEVLDYDKVLELDSLFEDAFSHFPPFLLPDGPMPDDAPPYLTLQRDVVLLGFYSRRARLHRPFLLHDKQDAHYKPSREICLRSARIVLSIAKDLLRASKDREAGSALQVRAITCRLGCVIGHMFMACTILVLNAGMDPSRGMQLAGEGHGLASATTSESHAEVAQACCTLASVGEQSAGTEKLVRNLVGVLRRYRIGGMDDVVSSDSEHAPTFGAESPNNVLDKAAERNNKTSGSNNDHNTDYSPTLHEDDLGLHGLWDDMLGDASAFGWDQLFAGLDTYCGPT
ncbi:hypothetical protein CSUB01_10417 [Colletotrichum sublineola]|uniref:Zn(2)-C6 fungal-type domain-containing protein n=1 Tax=Colletotrichum sublineola TaxID=1173701 RepID=A0A066XRB5_COLSU|nr:hypothetical protein CSUB01_10417 [Colletotrichum sublineola]